MRHATSVPTSQFFLCSKMDFRKYIKNWEQLCFNKLYLQEQIGAGFGQGAGCSQLTPGWNPSPIVRDMLSSLRNDQATAHWTISSQFQEGIPLTACFGCKLFWVHSLLKALELRSWGNCGPQRNGMSITRDWLKMQTAGPLPKYTESKSRGRTPPSVKTSRPRTHAQLWDTLT